MKECVVNGQLCAYAFFFGQFCWNGAPATAVADLVEGTGFEFERRKAWYLRAGGLALAIQALDTRVEDMRAARLGIVIQALQALDYWSLLLPRLLGAHALSGDRHVCRHSHRHGHRCGHRRGYTHRHRQGRGH